MKKRYIILFIFIGIFCFQFFVAERSELVAGQNGYYTYYEKYLSNEIDAYSSSAFNNDTYSLKLITDEISSVDDEIEKIRINIKKIYENLSSNTATLSYYKESIDTLRNYANKIKDVSSNIELNKQYLEELRKYIDENETELNSKFLYGKEIGFYLEEVQQQDSVLINYIDISNKLTSILQLTVQRTEEERARKERERRITNENHFRNSSSDFNSSSNNTIYSSYNYKNATFQSDSYNSRSTTEIKYYINNEGDKVQSPTYYNSQPLGATALCNDGTYSFSKNRRGTCSGHGGVKKWL